MRYRYGFFRISPKTKKNHKKLAILRKIIYNKHSKNKETRGVGTNPTLSKCIGGKKFGKYRRKSRKLIRKNN